MNSSEWKRTRLGENCDIITGFPFKSNKFNIEGQGVKLVRGKNVSKRFLRWGDDTRWWSEITPEIEKYFLKEDDVLIGMDGSLVGKNYVRVLKDDLPLLLVQRVACVRAKNGNDQKFIYYKIANNYFENYIDLVKTGTTIPHISGGQLSNYMIDLPPLGEQKSIANILSCIDGKIELNNCINKTLEEMSQAIFKSWFVDFDPFQEGEFEDSELGKIPKGWKLRAIYDLAEFTNGTSFKKEEYSDSGYPIIKIAELKNGITSSTQYFNGIKAGKYYIKSGDILFSWSGNPNTSIDTFIWAGGDAILNQHTFKISIKNNDYSFIYLLLKFFKPEFTRIASSKQTTGLGHVTIGDLKRLQFPFDEKAIGEYCNLINPVIDMYYNMLLENKKLVEIRDSLLPKLMSGEIKVPVEEVR